MITVQVEDFIEALEELKPILPHHWEELALDQDKVPLAPRWDIYEQQNTSGNLIFVTLRKSGDLIGYYIGFIAPGLHYKTCLECKTDIFYLYPEHRGAGEGFKLFQFVEKQLKILGVQRWFVGYKTKFDLEPLMNSLGLEIVEKFHSKWIGG